MTYLILIGSYHEDPQLCQLPTDLFANADSQSIVTVVAVKATTSPW